MFVCILQDPHICFHSLLVVFGFIMSFLLLIIKGKHLPLRFGKSPTAASPPV